MNSPTVDILLAAYNGAEYLRAQVDSLLSQTDQDFRILARDDGSTDATPDLLEDFSRRLGARFVVVREQEKRLGVIGNFGVLLGASEAEYVMFCDQDDVWHKEKIAVTRAAMAALTAQTDPRRPLLVHTDARVVSADLRLLESSFHARRGVRPGKCSLKRLLMQNVVLGASVMMNRSLAAMLSWMPPDARMHDHWAALVAASCGGAIGYLPSTTLDYRQHGGNAVGAGRGMEETANPLKKILFLRSRARHALRGNAAQAEALITLFGEFMPPESLKTVRSFTEICRLPQPMRASGLAAGGYLRRPWHENAGILLG